MAGSLSLLTSSKLQGKVAPSQSLTASAFLGRRTCPSRTPIILSKGQPQLAAGAAGSFRLRVEAKKALSEEESVKKGKKGNGLHPALAEAIDAPTAVLDKSSAEAEAEDVPVEAADAGDAGIKPPKKKEGPLMYMTESDDLSDKLSSKKEKKEEKKEKEREKEKEKEKKREKGLLDDMLQATAHYPDDADAHALAAEQSGKKKKKKYDYEAELETLQIELVKLQEWIRLKELRVVVIFEGRDAAGKGGIIKCITEATNPRIVKVKALAAPSNRERTEWYFQRYVKELPAGGEMALFDRSWYNRAGVERVMGFCTDEEYKEFLRSCPEFERMLVRAGIIVLKYWISVSPEEQEKRFKQRLSRPEKRWKLSDMDLEARARWADYSQAKDIMFSYCDIKQAPWYVVPADDKKAARLNCITHILSKIPYEDLIVPNDIQLPPLQEDHYVRPPITDQTFVPQFY